LPPAVSPDTPAATPALVEGRAHAVALAAAAVEGRAGACEKGASEPVSMGDGKDVDEDDDEDTDADDGLDARDRGGAAEPAPTVVVDRF